MALVKKHEEYYLLSSCYTQVLGGCTPYFDAKNVELRRDLASRIRSNYLPYRLQKMSNRRQDMQCVS
jgi:hypothetical protein